MMITYMAVPCKKMYSFKKNINRNNIFKNSFGKDNVEPILIKTLISRFYNN